MDNVASLEAQLAAAQRKAAQLEQDAQDCVVKLDRAEKLLAGLGNESVRWNAASEVLQKNLKFVIGNIVLAGGFIAYTGPFTAEFRRSLVQLWKQQADGVGLLCDPSWKAAEVLRRKITQRSSRLGRLDIFGDNVTYTYILYIS